MIIPSLRISTRSMSIPTSTSMTTITNITRRNFFKQNFFPKTEVIFNKNNSNSFVISKNIKSSCILRYRCFTTPSSSSSSSSSSTTASTTNSSTTEETSTTPTTDNVPNPTTTPTSSSNTDTDRTTRNPNSTTNKYEEEEELPPPPKEKRFKGPLSWKSFFATLTVGVIGLIVFRRAEENQFKEMSKSKTYGRIAIGGPFDLIDKDGKRVTSDSLKGKFVLIYFGFTHCPDICPAEMKKMEEVLAMYNQLPMHKNNPVIPIFITIDPHRDTPERLREYSKGYMPEMLWLTGSDENIRKVARAYRVFYSAPENPAENEDYLMEHTIFFYLANPDGEVVDYYGKILSANEIFKRLVNTVKEENRSSK